MMVLGNMKTKVDKCRQRHLASLEITNMVTLKITYDLIK